MPSVVIRFALHVIFEHITFWGWVLHTCSREPVAISIALGPDSTGEIVEISRAWNT